MFINPGFQDGDTFLRMLLQSDEFTAATLKELAPAQARARRGLRRKPSDKDAYAKRVADAHAAGTLAASEIIRGYAMQSRAWLTLLTGENRKRPSLRPAEDLLQLHGEQEWYGPVSTRNGVTCTDWYLRPFHVTYYALTTPEAPRVARGHVRWMVVAEVTAEDAAFHWNGFARYPNAAAHHQSQFEFWKPEYLPSAVEELKSLLKASWMFVPLNELVLEHLWLKYVDDPEYTWDHLHIRADAMGVALNARSAGAHEIDKRGLKALTGELTKAAVEALSLKPTPSTFKRVENAILRVLIKEWGTRSYDFRLDENTGTSRTRVFRGHCYFGNKDQGQDSLVHAHCFHDYGGSTGALTFLRSELDESDLA